jgi:uncharacterized damage-inducible protein DinB
MTTRRPKVPTQSISAPAQIFAASDRMNQILIANLDPAAWTAKLSPILPGHTRTIAAIFTHMHNIRVKWIRLTAPHLKVPGRPNRTHCTSKQIADVLAASATSCVAMLAEALGGKENGVKSFRRDGWAPAWPVGPEMLCYMLSHEAHHRGQVCMIAHMVGFPLPKEVTIRLWDWEKIWKERGLKIGVTPQTVVPDP